MNCATKGPCPHCGTNDWRIEKRGSVDICRCRSCVARRQRKRRRRIPHEPLYDGARRRARAQGIPFTLDLEDVRHVLSAWTCTYCEASVGSFAGGIRPNSATLDRLIPEEGYTLRNTVLACHRCNAAKAEHTPTSLRQWADRIESVINRQNPKEIE